MFTIETMTLEDVKFLTQWAADEGWNPGLDDANAFFQSDKNGFLMVKDAEVITACISVIKQGDHNGFLGLYICHPNHRGTGQGWKVWQAGMKYLEGRSIGLDGVPEQQDNYRKSGFEYHYRNIRYSGNATDLYPSSELKNLLHAACLSIRPAESDDFTSLELLDSQVHGLNRHDYLKSWLSESPSRKTLICVYENQLMGFGTIRACHQGFKIGPLIAQTTDIATLLVSALSHTVNSNELILDVPEPNDAALKLAQQLGLKPAFETARMYRGDAPAYQLQSLYGVTFFELG